MLYDLTHTWNLQKAALTEMKGTWLVTRGWGWGNGEVSVKEHKLPAVKWISLGTQYAAW